MFGNIVHVFHIFTLYSEPLLLLTGSDHTYVVGKPVEQTLISWNLETQKFLTLVYTMAFWCICMEEGRKKGTKKRKKGVIKVEMVIRKKNSRVKEEWRKENEYQESHFLQELLFYVILIKLRLALTIEL